MHLPFFCLFQLAAFRIIPLEFSDHLLAAFRIIPLEFSDHSTRIFIIRWIFFRYTKQCEGDFSVIFRWFFSHFSVIFRWFFSDFSVIFQSFFSDFSVIFQIIDKLFSDLIIKKNWAEYIYWLHIIYENITGACCDARPASILLYYWLKIICFKVNSEEFFAYNN